MKLIVLLDNDAAFASDILISSVEKYWKLTEYDFVKAEQCSEYISDDKYAVLGLFKHVSGDKSKKATEYTFSILLGNKKNKKVNDAEIVASVSLPDIETFNSGNKLMEYDYLIPFFIKNLDATINDYLNKKVNKIEKKKNAYFYNDGFEVLKNKKVLISKNATGKYFKIKQFCKNFSLKSEQVKLADKQEIADAIEAQDEQIAFIYDITTNGKIFDAKTSKPLAYGTGINVLKFELIGYSISAVLVVAAMIAFVSSL